MNLFVGENWPLLVVCIGMILAGVIDWWKRKVPNWLTFSLVLSGWLLGLLANFGVEPPYAGRGGIGASLVCTTLGFFLLFPLLLIKGMGAGDVKMQMGFGAWVGAFFGLTRHQSGSGQEVPGGLEIVFYAFCAGAIIGGIYGVVIMVVKGSYRQNVQNMREILMGVATPGGFAKVQAKGEELRAPKPLPYGVPLCIGFVGYLFYMYN
jgi:prepilin peptidase CpaA